MPGKKRYERIRNDGICSQKENDRIGNDNGLLVRRKEMTKLEMMREREIT